MTTRKTTKRALLGSVLALVLCFAMLLGSTYAWFTDTDSATVEKIVAGTLDINIYAKDATTDLSELQFIIPANQSPNHTHTYADFTELLWEPGATFETDNFIIKNDGSLALQYKLDVTTNEMKATDATGSEIANFAPDAVFTFALVDVTVGENGEENGTVYTITNNTADVLTEKLMEKGDARTYKLRVTMNTTVGNEYQGASFEGIKLLVAATQVAHEFDAKGNTYDESANLETVAYETTINNPAVGG